MSHFTNCFTQFLSSTRSFLIDVASTKKNTHTKKKNSNESMRSLSVDFRLSTSIAGSIDLSTGLNLVQKLPQRKRKKGDKFSQPLKQPNVCCCCCCCCCCCWWWWWWWWWWWRRWRWWCCDFSLPRLTFLAVTLNRAEVIRNCTSASAAACHAWTAWKDKIVSSCFILETKGK